MLLWFSLSGESVPKGKKHLAGTGSFPENYTNMMNKASEFLLVVGLPGRVAKTSAKPCNSKTAGP
jgi:hypothetical protein